MHARKGSSVRIVVPSRDDEDARDDDGAGGRPGHVHRRSSVETMCGRADAARRGRTGGRALDAVVDGCAARARGVVCARGGA